MKQKCALVRLRAARRGYIATILTSAFAFALCGSSPLMAQTRTWAGTALTNLANGAWGTAANWTDTNIPDTFTEVASLSKDWAGTTAGTPSFSLGNTGTNRDINGLIYDDTGTGTDRVGNINAGSTITLDGTNPYIQTTNSIVFNNTLAWGTVAWSKTGPTTLTLNATNSGSAPINMDAGAIDCGAAEALGTNAPTWTSGDTGRIRFSGGKTYANSYLINPGVTGAVGFGLLGHTGAGGVATITGTITFNGVPGSGGAISGSNTVGQELRIEGPINGSAGAYSQRDGRVIYAGGGNLTGRANHTSVAIIGANNGYPQGLSPKLGASAAATFDLNGFNQAIAGLELGTFNGTVLLNTGTLTLNGNLVTVGSTAAHVINATSGGTLALGATPRTFTIGDSTAANDLTINNATITGSAWTKDGAGHLLLSGVTTAPALTVSAGSLSIGSGVANTLTVPSLDLASGITINLDVAASGDLINGGTVTSAGATLKLSQLGGPLALNTYPLITYTGTSPGVTNFTADTSNMGRAVGNLIDTGSAIAFQVTGNDTVYWDGTTNNWWETGTTGNWKLTSDNSATDYFNGDVVTFPSTPSSTVDIGIANVTPAAVTFNNATGTDYTVIGGFGMTGTMNLVKNDTGKVTLSGTGAHSYTGTTTLNGGTFEVFQATSGLTATSSVTVNSPAVLRLVASNADFTFNSAISGNGTVELDGGVGGTAGSRTLQLTGVNTGFSGTLHLKTTGDITTNGSYRVSGANQERLGTAAIIVEPRAQLWTAGNVTNNITVSGYGYNEVAGGSPAGTVTGADGSTPILTSPTYSGIGAIRISNGNVLSGNITLNGDAKIQAHATTGTLSGTLSITNTGDTFVTGGSNSTTNSVLIITGNGSSLGRIWVNGGSTANSTHILQVGNGGTTGSIGSKDVILYTDVATSSLRFSRSDGYTLGSGQKIIAAHNGTATNLSRPTIWVNTSGTGLTLGGSAVIDIADGTSGGNLHVATNLADSILNIATGDTLDLGYLGINDIAAGFSGTVNQTGGDVSVINQLRVNHWGSSTAVYNLSGGTLTMTGASPNNTPSTTGGGAANATGDNNINALAVNTVLGGGTYIGIDGTGVFNHTGGTFTTNWIVLDNRGDTLAGTNMVDGIDRYNISNTALLKLRSTWGLIARHASTSVSFGGGTVQVDNTGTSGTTITTGPDITIPLSAIISTVASTTTTLDTNGAGNGFTLNRNVTGSGTLALTGGGTINLNSTGVQEISAALSSSGTSASINKIGSGITTIGGSMAGFTGPLTVTAGILSAPSSLAASSATVKDNASLFTEATVTSLILGDTTGGTLIIDPITSGAITAGTLTVNGDNLIDVSTTPAAGTVTAINYTTKTGTGTLSVANASSYRSTPTITDTGSQIQITFGAGKPLTWTGETDAFWDINFGVNWEDAVPADEKFFNGDALTFPEGGLNTTISLLGTLVPSSINVTATTTPYTFNSSANNQISGATGLNKSGTGVLTLNGPNLYQGINTITGGEVVINSPDSLGSGVAGNSIALSGGSGITYSEATAANLGANRTIVVGSGGGTLAHNNATGATITVPGAISGSGKLTLHSIAAGTGTFNITGDMSAHMGGIDVTSAGAGVTTLSFASGSIPPTSGDIVLSKPAAAAVNTSNNLNINGTTTLGAGLNIFMNAGLNSVLVLVRSTINSAGNNTIASPIKITATDTGAINQITSASGALTINGAITEATAGSAVAGSVLFLRGAGNITLNSQINLPSANVGRTDGGTLTINSTGNVWANTFISVGSVVLGVTDGLSTTAQLTMGQNDGNAVTFNMNGFNQTIGALISNPAVVNGFSTGKNITSATAPSTLTIDSTTNATYAGNITGQISLVKNGTSEQTLLGANTYTGSTTVNAGALIINGTTASTAGVTVSGGTLGGSGTIGGAASVASAGSVSPGMTGVAALTFSNSLTLSAGSTYRADITGAATSDRINSSSVTANGTIKVVLTGYAPVVGDVFDLVNGAITGTPTFDFSDAALTGSLEWDTSSFATDGTIKIISNDPYDGWIAGFSLTGPSAEKSADPDSDCLSNLLEFYLNGNPTVSSQSILPLLNASGTDFVFTFQRRDDAAGSMTSQLFQYGSTLASWTDVAIPVAVGTHAVGAATVIITDGGATDTVQVSVPKGAATSLYGRIKVVGE